jgi:hypothetical protein
MHKPLIVVLPLVLVAGGLAVAQTPPTATEAFNLRIRCKQMADHKAGEFADINAAGKWEILESWGSSRYDATNNRCYILIYQHIRKSGFGLEHVSSQLFDAQVDDLLANAEIRNGKKNGTIWDESYKGQRYFKDGEAAWDAAIKYMNELMADPRK